MRIVRVEVARVDLRLSRPYTIAYETIERAENLLVRVVTDGPHVGLGVAAPDASVTGETMDACEAALRGVVTERLLGADALSRMPLLEAMHAELPGHPATRAAVDMALLDLLGKAAGLPLWRMLGGYRPSIRTSVTLFIAPEHEVVREAKEWVARGFQALKLKGGVDVDEDVGRVLAVRDAVGPSIELRFDANQGYSVVQAQDFVARAARVGISLLEQPTPADQLGALRAVARSVRMPVMADESLLSLDDMFQLARRDAADMINVKLMKVGGLDAALLINAVARAAKLEVMVGCMDECELAIAAGLAFALSRKNVEYADLDGHLDLLDDPTAGATVLHEGALAPLHQPGFGLVDLRD